MQSIRSFPKAIVIQIIVFLLAVKHQYMSKNFKLICKSLEQQRVSNDSEQILIIQ